MTLTDLARLMDTIAEAARVSTVRETRDVGDVVGLVATALQAPPSAPPADRAFARALLAAAKLVSVTRGGLEPYARLRLRVAFEKSLADLEAAVTS